VSDGEDELRDWAARVGISIDRIDPYVLAILRGGIRKKVSDDDKRTKLPPMVPPNPARRWEDRREEQRRIYRPPPIKKDPELEKAQKEIVDEKTTIH
jgi:hypothetical protein